MAVLALLNGLVTAAPHRVADANGKRARASRSYGGDKDSLVTLDIHGAHDIVNIPVR